MAVERIETFAELHEALAPFKGSASQWIFRGHASIHWTLVPKAGRIRWLSGRPLADLEYFAAWKTRAIEYITARPESDWDWLAIAQHHGLATRLLDWTSHPLSAAFFALEPDVNEDAALFAYHPEFRVDTDTSGLADIPGVLGLKPKGVAQRITRQAAVFTVHSPPTAELSVATEGSRLRRFVIARTARKQLLRELDFYGVNRSTLFPDLDGLAAYMNWYAENGYDVSSPSASNPSLQPTSELHSR